MPVSHTRPLRRTAASPSTAASCAPMAQRAPRALIPWRSGLHRRAIRINHPSIDADRPLYSERPQGAGRPSAPAARRGRLLAPRRLATGTTDADAKCSHTPTSSSAAPATMPPSPAHRPGRDAAQRTPFPSPPEPSRRGARSRRAGESLGPNPPSPGAIGGGEGCSSARTPLDRPPGRSRAARSPLAAGAASPALIRARARAITHLCRSPPPPPPPHRGPLRTNSAGSSRGPRGREGFRTFRESQSAKTEGR